MGKPERALKSGLREMDFSGMLTLTLEVSIPGTNGRTTVDPIEFKGVGYISADQMYPRQAKKQLESAALRLDYGTMGRWRI